MPRKEKLMDVRERILKTAARLFFSQGYNSTGINQIIAEAGVAKASLYQHYPSKDDLLLAYLQVASAEWFDSLDYQLKELEFPKDRMLAAFDLLLVYMPSVCFKGCHFQNIISEIPAKNDRAMQQIEQHKQRMKQFFADESSKMGKSELGEELALLFEGAIISSQIFRQNKPIETAKNLAERLI